MFDHRIQLLACPACSIVHATGSAVLRVWFCTTHVAAAAAAAKVLQRWPIRHYFQGTLLLSELLAFSQDLHCKPNNLCQVQHAILKMPSFTTAPNLHVPQPTVHPRLCIENDK
jgi:hypothetical protein